MVGVAMKLPAEDVEALYGAAFASVCFYGVLIVIGLTIKVWEWVL